MKRLVKKSDVYYPPEIDRRLTEEKATELTKYYCTKLGMTESYTEIYLNGYDPSITMGNYEEDGFKVMIYFYNEKEGPKINRILLSMGKGRGYIETREQNILDDFLTNELQLINWANETLDELEERLHKKFLNKEW